ncbi:type IV pilus biogenesis protein PilM [Pseudomonas sp. S75]|uniref:type IV pilus biogenesis protein PilM n=1 Tax=Pseudomonas sp. S75 TaxID=2767446 RepID=UPI001909E89A|nr:type IV pilus biogenesis protein PilM [Pseudomonas sp. S75]MBK0155589.1 type IV pilus biogenesis protein PilM [Pseudomonas sp. S75]
MYVYWITMTLLIVAGSICSQMQYSDETISEQATIDTLSRSMLIYRSAAAEYARANPGFTGAPTDSSLNLPSWYTKQSGIATYIVSGVSYTYIAGTVPTGLPAALTERTESATVGVKRYGQLFSPKVGNMAIAVPAPVPEGAVVAVY